MKCEKCGKEMKVRDGLLMSNPPKHRYDCECGHVDYQVARATLSTSTAIVTVPIEQFKQIEAKANELDLRDKGVAVIWDGDSAYCGNCMNKNIGGDTYCERCGFKTIWEEVDV